MTGIANLVTTGLSDSEKLFYLYFFGSAQAIEDFVSSAGMKLQAAVSLVIHAVPEIHNFLTGQYAYYEAQDTAGKAKYICGLVGTLAPTIIIALATDGATAIWSSSADAATLLEANASWTEIFDVEGEVSGTPFVDVPIDFASSQGADYWQAYANDLAQLQAGGVSLDVGTQQALIRDISDRIGVPSHAEEAGIQVSSGVGRGYCGSAAADTVLALSRGGLVCAVPYFQTDEGPTQSSVHQIEADFAAMGAKTSDLDDTYPSTAAMVELDTQAKLAEGEMAFLFSKSSAGGHATVLIKLKGVVYNINNQGWDTGSTLQTFSEWAATFEGLVTDNSTVYGYFYTGLKLLGN